MDDEQRTFGYLTTSQVAEMAGVSERQVRHVCQNGGMVAFKLGRMWWILPGSADSWVHSDRRPGPPLKGKGKVKGRQLVMDVDGED